MRNSLLNTPYLCIALFSCYMHTLSAIEPKPTVPTMQERYDECNITRIALLRSCDSCGLMNHINDSITKLNLLSTGIDLKNAPSARLNQIAALNKHIAACCQRFLKSMTAEEKQKLQNICQERAKIQKNLYSKSNGPVQNSLSTPEPYSIENSFFI